MVERDTLKIVAHAAHPSLVGTSPEGRMPNSKRALQDSPDDLDGDGTALDPYVTSTARDQTPVPGIAWLELHDGYIFVGSQGNTIQTRLGARRRIGPGAPMRPAAPVALAGTRPPPPGFARAG